MTSAYRAGTVTAMGCKLLADGEDPVKEYVQVVREDFILPCRDRCSRRSGRPMPTGWFPEAEQILRALLRLTVHR
jgi:hypothetical protein